MRPFLLEVQNSAVCAEKIRKELGDELEWEDEVIETHLTPNFIFRKV